MRKFGFGKKNDAGAGDDDASRSALFGRSSKTASTAPAASNPYAQASPATSNPYAQSSPASDPYAQESNKYAHMPASSGAPYQRQNSGGLPSGPSPNRGPTPSGGGYNADRYGSGAGYGANRYEGSDSNLKYGPSGYGGLGRTPSVGTTNTEDNREELFGGAKDRYAQRGGTAGGGVGAPANSRPGAGYGAGSEGSSAEPSYGAYGENRQLTAEEEEEEDTQATKQQIRFLKQESVASTRNALQIAAQAEESGRSTLARLGGQGERIHNTEKNLDLAANHNRVAEERARELKTLNSSMFAVHIGNPFTSSSRNAARDEEIINKHRMERDERESSRAAAFGSQKRMQESMRDLEPGNSAFRPQQTKASLAERSKYQFEADSEDEELENEIDGNLDALGHAAGRLNALARATGKEVDAQNVVIERIIGKSDKVDDQIAMNRARLDRIN